MTLTQQVETLIDLSIDYRQRGNVHYARALRNLASSISRGTATDATQAIAMAQKGLGR